MTMQTHLHIFSVIPLTAPFPLLITGVGSLFWIVPRPNNNRDPIPPKEWCLMVGGLGLVHHSYIGLITNQFVHKSHRAPQGKNVISS